MAVYNNPKIESYCKTLKYNDWEELRSELIIQLCKMSDTKLDLAYRNNFLDYLCFKIIKRIVYGSIKDTGIFNKKVPLTTHIEGFDGGDVEKVVDDLDKIMEILEGLHWYNKILFKAYYIEGMNLRQISEKYGINIKSIHYTIRQTKKVIKSKLNIHD